MAVLDTHDLNRQLLDVERDAHAAGERFMESRGEEVERYRREISDGLTAASERLQVDVAEITANNPLCTTLTKQLCDYVEWLQWSLWDLPYFAVPVGIDPDTFRQRVAGCGYVYLAGRVLDDAFDRHFTYKTKRRTLFSVAVDETSTAQAADRLAVISGVLLLTEGLSRLAADTGVDALPVLRKVLQSVRRALIGAMMEHTAEELWNDDFYERLVVLKNVDFWRTLYSAVDPERQSPLYPFLERYYALAQKFNDLLDFPEDLKRGQPNLLSVRLYSGNGNGNGNGNGHGAANPGRVPADIERSLATALLDLASRAESMPPTEKSVALLKLGESIRSARQLGLFAVEEEPSPAPSETEAPAEGPRVEWYSTLADVVAHWGAGAIEDARCEVCGSRERKRMLEFRGFTYHSCLECTHVYVAPRVRLELLLDLASHHEHDDDENEFLEIQKIYAEPICHLIRLRAPGNRLLDLGFGRGHIMRLARAYGFEVYGMDSSQRLVGQLASEFGNRLNHGTLGADPIPWGAFDAIVMSHVVEHLVEPVKILRDVLAKLAPGGLLYVAVPNIDSLQFKIFGKHWDAINPMVHMQYFNESSLARLLKQAGFVNPERIQFPPMPRSMVPQWMHLFRELGGDESGELAIVAQRPAGEDG